MISFLAEKGIAVEEEVPLIGYEIDVGCIRQGIFIECGDTETKKIFSIMFNGHSVGLLQYNSEHVVWFRPKPGFQKQYGRDAMDYFGLYYDEK